MAHQCFQSGSHGYSFLCCAFKIPFWLAGTQIGNYLLLQFLGMALSTILWRKVAERYKFKGISFLTLIGGLLPVLVLILSRRVSVFFNGSFFLRICVSAGRIRSRVFCWRSQPTTIVLFTPASAEPSV